MAFTGFTKETIRFLFELGVHNDRDWFRENRERYQKHVLEPFQELVRDLGKKMLKIDPSFEITPAVDKTISRIYRDTRFSKDKTPYRDHVWISFKRNSGDWKMTPVYFFELFPDYYHYGMGFFIYPAPVREMVRRKILSSPATFLKMAGLSLKKGSMEIAGEKFKRVMDKDQPAGLREWYERKELYLYRKSRLDNAVFGAGLVEKLFADFSAVKPVYDFLWKAIR